MFTKFFKNILKCISVSVKADFSDNTKYNKQAAEEFFGEAGNNFYELNFKNFRGWCRVLSVYDGDTITVGIPFDGKVFKQSIRMSGIDTPEIKSRDKENAILSRYRLVELITQNKNTTKEMFYERIYLVWFECDGFDKYKRLLGTLKLEPNQESLSDILIREGLGKIYDGGKKY
jgi:endonuclease YncB( thermonuclease family)